MITLIRPPAVETARFTTSSLCPPLGLAYIAGSLEAAGESVEVIDAVASDPRRFTPYVTGFLVGSDLDEVVRRVDRRSEWIGISAIFTHEWPAVVELIRRLKAASPETRVVVGGEHVTALPEFSLATSLSDVLVLGEGEETILELTAALRSGRSLDSVPGIAFRTGTRVRVNPRRARRKDIDAIASPAWHRFDLEAYHRERYAGGVYTGRLTVPVLATRGCPYQCSYCSSPNMWTTAWIPRDPEAVADELAGYVERFGAGNFPFQDLTAVLRKGWILAFCRALERRGLSVDWQLPSGTRSEAIDGEVAGALKRSGMVGLSYAPESGSDETRARIKKHMQTDRTLQSIRSAAGAGLSVSLFLVLGLPGDEAYHLSRNLPFARRAAAAGADDLAVGFYMALPGTELFRSLWEAGRVRVDRAYFRHILHGISWFPKQSYHPMGVPPALPGRQ